MSEDIKDRVYNYVVNPPDLIDDEVAAALHLDIVTVISALIELEKEGRVKGETVRRVRRV